MKNINAKKGVTLTSLIITVTIMLIIGGTVIYNGINDARTATENKLLSEIRIVQQAVFQAYSNYKKTGNEAYIVGTKVNVSNLANSLGITLVTIPQEIANTNEGAYYRIEPIKLKDIGIENSQDTYIVNYYTRRSN